MNDFHPFVFGGDFVGNRTRGIPAAIIDNDDFVVSVYFVENTDCLMDSFFDICLFIITGEKDTDRDR